MGAASVGVCSRERKACSLRRLRKVVWSFGLVGGLLLVSLRVSFVGVSWGIRNARPSAMSTSTRFAAKKAAVVQAEVQAEDEDDNILSFGKHRGKLYSEILEEAPEYCAWAVQTADGGADISEALQEFAAYCRGRLSLDALNGDVEEGGDVEITFGKHRGETRQSVLETDPEYCEWVLKAALEPSSMASLKGFAKFIKDSGEIEEKLEVTFGKYKGRSYEDVMKADTDYCNWVLDAGEKPDATSSLRHFAAYLKGQGVEAVEAPPPNKRKVGFGKYKDLTIQELHDQDPEYAKWMVTKAKEEGAGGRMKSVAETLEALYPDAYTDA